MAEQIQSKPKANMLMPGQKGKRIPDVEKAANAGATLKRLLSYFRQEKTLVIGLFSIVTAIVIVSILAPKYQSQAIDLLTQKRMSELPRTLGIMAGIYILEALGALLRSRLSAKLSQRIIKRLRTDLFEKIVNLPTAYIDSHPHGDIMSRMTNDVENISNTVSQSLASFVSGILTIIGTIAMMLSLCWQLTLCSGITVILIMLITKYLSKVMTKYYRKRQSLLGELNSTVEEMVTGYRSVTAYNRQDEVIDSFEKTSDNLSKAGIWAEVLSGTMGPLMNSINNIGFVIVATIGGAFALRGMISVGVISAFITYSKQAHRPLKELATLYGQIQTAIAGAERVFAIMDQPSEDKSGQHSMEGVKGAVSFKHVNFSYVPGKQIIHDFNLDIPAGDSVALVGSTGSGKTTIINLLMRFYEIDSGEISIDGINIKNINCNNLRDDIAIVLQDTILFSDTIRGNITYADPNVSDSEMVEAAKICNIHQMVQSMKDGYNTMLNEGGGNLSQGQQQLIAICRAIIDKPKILILDEATSSVDTRTEKHIQDAMKRLMEGRTSIIIAHRLSTIQDADKIIVMDQGHIVECGNHQELLTRKGHYYELYMTQFAGKAI